MSPGLKIWTACTALAVRTRPKVLRSKLDAFRLSKGPIRCYSDDGNGPQGRPTKFPGPQTAQNPVRIPSDDEDLRSNNLQESNEDKVPIDKSAQNGQTDTKWEAEVNDQGTFLDAIAQTELLEAMYGGKPGYVHFEGNLTDAQLDKLYEQGIIPHPEEAQSSEPGALKPPGEEIGQDALQPPPEDPRKVEGSGTVKGAGLKFDAITKPYPAEFNLKKRYHPVLNQLTRLLMRDGKLSVAQRNMAMVLTYLRTSPAPIYSPKYPLLPGTPPASYLPLNPVLYITIAIDSVAPLISIRHVTGGAGGGRALEIPVPLAVRQRRRIAFKWILDLINKRPSRGSGRNQFPTRVAEEIIAVVEGRSSAWEKRTQIHKLGTAARANVGKRAIKKWG